MHHQRPSASGAAKRFASMVVMAIRFCATTCCHTGPRSNTTMLNSGASNLLSRPFEPLFPVSYNKADRRPPTPSPHEIRHPPDGMLHAYADLEIMSPESVRREKQTSLVMGSNSGPAMPFPPTRSRSWAPISWPAISVEDAFVRFQDPRLPQEARLRRVPSRRLVARESATAQDPASSWFRSP